MLRVRQNLPQGGGAPEQRLGRGPEGPRLGRSEGMEPRAQRGPTTRSRFGCGSTAHLLRDCPKNVKVSFIGHTMVEELEGQ
jgi:hypothetical protein